MDIVLTAASICGLHALIKLFDVKDAKMGSHYFSQAFVISGADVPDPPPQVGLRSQFKDKWDRLQADGNEFTG